MQNRLLSTALVTLATAFSVAAPATAATGLANGVPVKGGNTPAKVVRNDNIGGPAIANGHKAHGNGKGTVCTHTKPKACIGPAHPAK